MDYRSCHWLIAILSLSLILFNGPVYAFFPSNFREYIFGLGGTSHQSITRDVIDDILTGSTRYFPEVTSLTTYMKKAREEIADNVQKPDDLSDPENDLSETHFDGENFDGGQTRLLHKIDEIVASLQAPGGVTSLIDVTNAREQLGRALHTVQDFYAHTNWVEMGQENPHPDLGMKNEDGSPKEIVFAREKDPTCVDCKGSFDLACAGACMVPGYSTSLLTNIIAKGFGFIATGACFASCTCPDCSANLIHTNATGANALGGDLTSGYYQGEGKDAPPGVAKCHHGGLSDFSTGGILSPLQYRTGINKDSLACNWSPHHDKHHKAVDLAKRASRAYIDIIKGQLTDLQLRLLFGIGPTLAFAIDTTGSMNSVIDSVRAETIKIVDDRVGTPNQPSLFILAPFNDPGIGPLTSTPDADLFKSSLNALTATGGGDCPELSMEGMLLALDALPTGGTLIMITDAAAKHPESANQVIAKAGEKKIKIYIFLFNSECSDDPAYDRVTSETGGQLFNGLDLGDADLIPQLIDVVVSADIVNLIQLQFAPSHNGPPLDLDDFDYTRTPSRLARKSFWKRADSSPYNASAILPLDPAMSRVTFSVSGAKSLTLTRPDGSIVKSTDGGVSTVTLTSGIFITATSPAAGLWKASISECANCTLAVFGDSALDFTSFDFVEPQGGHHPGYFPINATLIPGTAYPVIARLDGNFTSANFSLRAPDGRLITLVNMKPGTGEEGMPPINEFFGAVEVPNENFLVYVNGEDKDGQHFVRVLPALLGNTQLNGTANGTTLTNSTSILPISTPLYPNSTISSETLGPIGAGATAPMGSGYDYKDTTTLIVKTTVSMCPVSSTFTSSGITHVESTLSPSTITITSTSIIPCKKCTGANYPQNTGLGGPGHGNYSEGNTRSVSVGELTTTIVVITSLTTCPVVNTITAGTATYLQTTEIVSTVLHAQTTIIPYFSSAATSATASIGPTAAAATSPSALSLESSATETVATSNSGISGNGSGIISSTSTAYTGPMATGGAPRLLGMEGGIGMGMVNLVGLGFLFFVGAVVLAV